MTLHTVLGASGLIGSQLVKYLRRIGERVIAVGRHDPINWKTDLGHVYYCIGITADFRQRMADTVNAHVHVLQDILEKAHFESLLYLSSTRVYQNVTDTQEGASLIVNPSDPSDLYNLSKLMGESLCLTLPHASVRIARISNVITSYRTANSPNFFDAILDSIVSKKHITLQTALDSEKDYIDLEDVISLLVRIAQQGKERVYNVARGQNTSSAMLIDLIGQQLGFDFTVDVAPNSLSAKFPPISVKRIITEFDFAPKAILQTIHEHAKALLALRGIYENPS